MAKKEIDIKVVKGTTNKIKIADIVSVKKINPISVSAIKTIGPLLPNADSKPRIIDGTFDASTNLLRLFRDDESVIVISVPGNNLSQTLGFGNTTDGEDISVNTDDKIFIGTAGNIYETGGVLKIGNGGGIINFGEGDNIQIDSANSSLALGTIPDTTHKMRVATDGTQHTTAIRADISAAGGTNFGMQIRSTSAKTSSGTTYGLNSNLSGTDSSGEHTYIALRARADGATNNYGIQSEDGSEGTIGHVLGSVTTDGKARWIDPQTLITSSIATSEYVQQIAYVETSGNGGDDDTAVVNDSSLPFENIKAAVGALTASQCAIRIGTGNHSVPDDDNDGDILQDIDAFVTTLVIESDATLIDCENRFMSANGTSLIDISFLGEDTNITSGSTAFNIEGSEIYKCQIVCNDITADDTCFQMIHPGINDIFVNNLTSTGVGAGYCLSIRGNCDTRMVVKGDCTYAGTQNANGAIIRARFVYGRVDVIINGQLIDTADNGSGIFIGDSTGITNINVRGGVQYSATRDTNFLSLINPDTSSEVNFVGDFTTLAGAGLVRLIYMNKDVVQDAEQVISYKGDVVIADGEIMYLTGKTPKKVSLDGSFTVAANSFTVNDGVLRSGTDSPIDLKLKGKFILPDDVALFNFADTFTSTYNIVTDNIEVEFASSSGDLFGATSVTSGSYEILCLGTFRTNSDQSVPSYVTLSYLTDLTLGDSTTNVTAAGALMDSEVTNLAEVKAFDSTDYAGALGSDENYVSDTELGNIRNTSGTNTGDQDLSGLAAIDSPVFSSKVGLNFGTPSEILITNETREIISAPVSTYPSLAELAYGKGVTSAIQTQLNTKVETVQGISPTSGDVSPTLDSIADGVTRQLYTETQAEDSGIKSGTSFPGSPNSYQRYFRTDIGKMFEYDNSRSKWLSTDAITLYFTSTVAAETGTGKSCNPPNNTAVGLSGTYTIVGMQVANQNASFEGEFKIEEGVGSGVIASVTVGSSDNGLKNDYTLNADIDNPELLIGRIDVTAANCAKGTILALIKMKAT